VLVSWLTESYQAFFRRQERNCGEFSMAHRRLPGNIQQFEITNAMPNAGEPVQLLFIQT
jgi:hypothetical protein